ncbi:hypothetical protein KSAC_09270 [Komagataeibacter saccharivorans]|uniref:hypothetical protein n=1 Tax=Komagataeibacter saccharivorans TaxID=265959 RepID=UPI00104A7859|nr:hypothetical protein [Komagataeibacter saccharivorans]QBL93168.1 hypothetical protein KSAC_09270 [Komagataeibacter saccharivorans]
MNNPSSIKFVLVIFCCMMLSACAIHPAKISTTIPQAMAGIQSSLAQAGVVPVSHTGSWTAKQDGRFVQAVRAAQCSQHTSDPVVGAIAGNVTLGLSGQFTQAGQFTMGAMTTVPTVGVEGSASRTRAQTVNLPVAYAPLSSLPDVEMSRQISYETEMLAQNDDARHTEATRLIANREELRGRIQAMIDSWSATECIQPLPVVPFVGRHDDPNRKNR